MLKNIKNFIDKKYLKAEGFVFKQIEGFFRNEQVNKTLIKAAQIIEEVPITQGKKNPISSTLFTSVLDTICYAGLGVLTATAIMFNKKIPEDKREYMVPQEWAEAAINCVSVLTINQAAMEAFKQPVQRGWIHPGFEIDKNLKTQNPQKFAELNNLLAKLKDSQVLKIIFGSKDEAKNLFNELKDKNRATISDKTLNAFKSLTKDKAKQDELAESLKVLKPLVNKHSEVFNQQVNNIKQLRKNCMVGGSIFGLAVALSVVMPFFVNKFATWYKNKYGSKLKNIPDKPASLNPLGAKPLAKNPLFDDFKTGKINFGERAKMTKNKALAFTLYSSGLRI